MINVGKSFISYVRVTDEDKEYFTKIFLYKHIVLEERFKYLVFHFKPNSYLTRDWIWSIAKVEKIINV